MSVDRTPVLQCDACDHRFAGLARTSHDVAETYDDDYFFGGGAGYGNYLGERDIIRSHGRRYAKIVSRFMAPGSMLDVGAAAGFLMDGFRSFHWQCTGLEPNRNLAERAQQEGYTMHVATLEEFASPEKFQLICMVQVIAHLYDVPRALRNAARHTADQGYWLIETWNYRSLTARFFGRHWHEYSPPSVLHWFSPKSLARLASQFQMVPVARGRPRKLLNGAHAKSLLRYRLQRTAIGRAVAPCIRLLPDRLTIPYPCEDLFWLLLRRQ